jgi:hypothetical protein
MNEQQLRLARMAGITLKESDYSEEPEQVDGELEQTPAERLAAALASIPDVDSIEGCEGEIEALITAAEALSAACAPVDQEQEQESDELTEGASSSYMFSKKSKELFDIDEDTYIEVKAESPIQAVIKAKELFKKDGYTGKIHLVS